MSPPLSSTSTLNDDVLVIQTRFDALNKGKTWVENQFLGWAIICDTKGNIKASSPNASSLSTFIRSAAKPFQALPLVSTGAVNKLFQKQLALACASHAGCEEHIEVVTSILKQVSLDESSLQCGEDWPVDRAERIRLKQSGASARKIYHNCSGKHAGMLFCCQHNGWSVENYLDLQHPLQQMILEQLKILTGFSEIPLAIDGCGAPVFYLPLLAMAQLYAHLAVDEQFKSMREAMTLYPELVGGLGRIDTLLMQITQGRLLAKVGADGVLCVAHLEKGLGFALKVADGSAEIRNFAVVKLLVKWGWLSELEAQDFRLKNHCDSQRINSQGKVIGKTLLT
jgi:L-asparaginase